MNKFRTIGVKLSESELIQLNQFLKRRNHETLSSFIKDLLSGKETIGPTFQSEVLNLLYEIKALLEQRLTLVNPTAVPTTKALLNLKSMRRCGWDLNPRSPKGKRLSKPSPYLAWLPQHYETYCGIT